MTFKTYGSLEAGYGERVRLICKSDSSIVIPEFYVKTRSADGNLTSWVCADKMSKTDVTVKFTDEDFKDGKISAISVLNKAVAAAGFGGYGAPAGFPLDCIGDLPRDSVEDKSARSILEMFAAAMCGYWLDGESNQIIFVQFGSYYRAAGTNIRHTPIKYGGEKRYSRLIMYNGDAVYTAGSGRDEDTLMISTELASERLCAAVYDSICHYEYKAWSCEKGLTRDYIYPGLIRFPGAELICTNVTMSPSAAGIIFTASANAVPETDYAYKSQVKRQLDRKLEIGQRVGNTAYGKDGISAFQNLNANGTNDARTARETAVIATVYRSDATNTKLGTSRVSENTDGTALWEFDGDLKASAELLTDSKTIIGAINELKKDLDGEGGDWQPPADWLPVPEPGEWEACFLVELTNPDKLEYTVDLCHPKMGYGCGTVTVDWGDGTIETGSGFLYDENGNHIGGETSRNRPVHTYAHTGQYVIKIVGDSYTGILGKVGEAFNINKYPPALLIAKLGANIGLILENDSRQFGDCYRLRWVSIKSSTELSRLAFYNCYALRRVDTAKPVTKLPNSVFGGCRGMESFDFSEVVEVENNALYDTGFTAVSMPKCVKIANTAVTYNTRLREFYAPICISAGQQGFFNNYALEAAYFAENCVFGTNCFQNCYNLYPRPDGSTN